MLLNHFTDLVMTLETLELATTKRYLGKLVSHEWQAIQQELPQPKQERSVGVALDRLLEPLQEDFEAFVASEVSSPGNAAYYS